MGYYVDLFLRPKQATIYALQNPSLVRAVGMVLLGTIAGIITSLLFAGTVFIDSIISFLAGDVLRWVASGIILLLLGLIFKRIPITSQNISRALSVLAQLNVYGFLMYLVLGLILPAIVIPDLITATNQYSQDIIGPEEYDIILSESLASSSDLAILALPLIAIGVLFLLYGVYVLFLSVQKYLDTSVFKSILGMLIILAVQSVLVILLNGGF